MRSQGIWPNGLRYLWTDVSGSSCSRRSMPNGASANTSMRRSRWLVRLSACWECAAGFPSARRRTVTASTFTTWRCGSMRWLFRVERRRAYGRRRACGQRRPRARASATRWALRSQSVLLRSRVLGARTPDRRSRRGTRPRWGRYWRHGGNWYRCDGRRWIVWGAPFGLFVPFLPWYYTTVWREGVPYCERYLLRVGRRPAAVRGGGASRGRRGERCDPASAKR